MKLIQTIAILMLLAIAIHIQRIRGDMAKMSKKSHVEDFEGATALFEALTSSPNDGYTYEWRVHTFTINSNDIKDVEEEEEQEVSMNCTVLYLDECTSWNKCRQTCEKTGAASYRWFHDGCCECVGGHCLGYGINESRCSQCPEPSCDSDD
ncbi:protein twisted gastrulation [Drosophila grimshawi]|uniref:GH15535 n=1 Tax=Drosophila grimshawi TaxID=7222 RepID=B4J1H8_DROGR|nr:protein twisted gastrulation [Drosophila grimshawi]EDV95869.1 GH15535 [Drosophila grimshawi]